MGVIIGVSEILEYWTLACIPPVKRKKTSKQRSSRKSFGLSNDWTLKLSSRLVVLTLHAEGVHMDWCNEYISLSALKRDIVKSSEHGERFA